MLQVRPIDSGLAVRVELGGAGLQGLRIGDHFTALVSLLAPHTPGRPHRATDTDAERSARPPADARRRLLIHPIHLHRHQET